MLGLSFHRRGLPHAPARTSRPRAVAVAMTIAFVLVATGFIAVFFAGPAQARSSTLTVLEGQVLVRHGAGEFAPIDDGDLVSGGDTLRTAANSRGVLTLFDGTTIEIEPETEMTVTQLRGTASGDKIVELSQAIGRTWHVVTHLASPRSSYEIKTRFGSAAVRGTAFQVAVLADGTMTTTTTEGDVAVSADGAEVHVLAGQSTTVVPGSPPPPPRPAPAPEHTLRITLELTRNAIVTDANGRAVGLQDGRPVRYVPGSTVEMVDGKLVMTIPDAPLGLLSTFVKPDPAALGGAAPATVTVGTQLTIRDAGTVAGSLTSGPVDTGTATGAVVLTDTALVPVSLADATNLPQPHIGAAPPSATGSLAILTGSTPAPVVAPSQPLAPPKLTPPAIEKPVLPAAPVATPAGFAPATDAFTPALPTLTPILQSAPPIVPVAPTPLPVPAPTPVPTLAAPIAPNILVTPSPTVVPILRSPCASPLLGC